MSASLLSAELGVPQGEPLENHAAYLKHWLEGMKGASSFIIKASSQASKVADYLLSFVRDDQEATEEEQAGELVGAARSGVHNAICPAALALLGLFSNNLPGDVHENDHSQQQDQ